MTKRRAIMVVTFLAGLFYVLEFLLPPRVGGGLDNAGASAPTMVNNGDTGGVLLVYTARAETRDPVLAARSVVNGVAGAEPFRFLTPSAVRQPDYRGAMNPQWFGLNRLYYTGLGYDGKTARLCAADRRDGTWAPRPEAILQPGGPGSWDASGIAWAHVIATGPSLRLWYVGRQGNVGRIGTAASRDGVVWSKSVAPVYDPGAGASVESVTVLRTSAGLRVWWVQTGPGQPQGSLMTSMVSEDDGRPIGAPTAQALVGPTGAPGRGDTLLDFRTGAFGWLGPGQWGCLSYASSDGKPRTAAITMAPDAAAPGSWVLTRTPQPMVELGAAPRSTLFSDMRTPVDNLIVVVGAFAVGLGLIGLGQVHGKRILALQRGWQESTAFFVAAFAMAAFTVYARLHPDARTWGSQGYNLLFYGMLQPLGSSMFSLLAAYLVSAAYRAFRVRSLESGLLAASAMLIMLGQVPIGNWLTQGMPEYLQIPKVMAWVLFVTNNAVVRAVNFGIFVGAMATALRVWLSMDRASMRSVE